MIITIDFFNKTIYLDGVTLEKASHIGEILKAAGENPDEFQICQVMNFENDNTGEFDIKYVTPKNDVN